MSVKQPEFIVIGSQKAGTSSLFVGLNRHPEVFMAPGKELNYFYDDALFTQGPKRYADFFKDAPADSICGEASPGYICHPRAPGRIHRQIPNVKLIVTLRDPVERAYSQYWDNRRQLAEGRTFGALLEGPQHQVFNPARKNYFTRGLYSVYLERYLALFPREQLLIIQFDELKRDPDAVYRRCFEFIGVNPDVVGDEPHEIANVRSVFANPLYNFVFKRPALAAKLPSFLKRLLRWGPEIPYTPEPVEADVEERLRAYYAPYDRALETILGEAPYWASTSERLTAEAPELP